MNQPTPASVEPAHTPPRFARGDEPDVSIVIPVFNSATVVGETIDRVAACLSASGVRHEIIAVNDASTDQSWHVLARKTRDHPALAAINLARNCGQRAATMCGLEASTGAYVITIDVTGLAMLCARHPANVRIAPPAKPRRQSNYTLAMRLRLLPALLATAPRRHSLFAGLLSLCAIILFAVAMFTTLPPWVAAAATGVVLLVVACLAVPAVACVAAHAHFRRRRRTYASACGVTEIVSAVRANEPARG